MLLYIVLGGGGVHYLKKSCPRDYSFSEFSRDLKKIVINGWTIKGLKSTYWSGSLKLEWTPILNNSLNSNQWLSGDLIFFSFLGFKKVQWC